MLIKSGRTWGGDTGHLASMHITFEPSDALAMTALTQTLGDGHGQQQIFIEEFTKRPAGHAKDLPPVRTKGDDDYPYSQTFVVSDKHMTGVLAQLWAGPDQAVGGTLSVWFFG